MKIKERQALKKLLKELDKMRITKHFMEYGLGKGGKNHKWLERLNEIKQDKFVSVNGLITTKYLHMLALQYALHSGDITSYADELQEIITGYLK